MPSWSVPPGLTIPGPRQPEADAQPSESGPRPSEPGPRPSDPVPGLLTPVPRRLPQSHPPTAVPGPASRPQLGGSCTPPSHRQLPARSRTSAQEPLGDQPGQRFVLRVPAPAPARRHQYPPQRHDGQRHRPIRASSLPPSRSPRRTRAVRPATPASPWPNARAVPSPTREPDGSWSSPLTPKPARRPLSPTQARYGRAGGPGFQPTRSDQAGSQGAGTEGPGLSPWQRSHQLWTEAGIEWERRPAPQLPWHPTASRSAARPARARQVSPPRPPAPPRPEHTPRPEYAPQPEHAPQPEQTPRPEHMPQPEYAPRPEQTPWPDSYVPTGWAGRTPVPLGAPVYSEPGVDEDDDPAGAAGR